MPTATVLDHKLANINGFFLDCLISDNHQFDAEITDFPVENGSTISDNIRNKPLVVTMECLVSNSPLGQLRQLRDKDSDPIDSAYDLMLKIRNDRQPIFIGTSLRTYENMALQNLGFSRKSGGADNLEFTAVFKQIELVINNREKRVAIVTAKGPAKPGAAASTTLLPDNSQDSVRIYIDPNGGAMTWYDVAISGWRQSVNPPTANEKGVVTAGITTLVEGRPDDIDPKAWARLDSPEKRSALAIQPIVIKNQGSHAGRPLFGKLFQNVNQLMRGEFQIFRLVF